MLQPAQLSLGSLAVLAQQPPPPSPAWTEAEACNEQADVVILVDISGSIQETTLVGTRQFLADLFRQPAMESGAVQLGVLGFNEGVTTLVPLDHQPEDIAVGINRLQSTGGGTDISRALYAADGQLVQSGRSEGQYYIILITDGDVNNKDRLLDIGSTLKTNGVTLIVVGVDSGPNTGFLMQLANEDYFFPIDDYDLLDSVSEALVTTTSCGIPVELVEGAVVPVIQPTQALTSTSVPIVGTPTSVHSPIGRSDSDTDFSGLLPFLIISLALMILGGLLRSRKTEQHSTGTGPVQPPNLNGSPYSSEDQTNIRDKVSNIPYPSSSKPLTTFHEEVLIIGIGATGAKALDHLIERMDDTNTLNAPSRPMLMHLRMSKIDEIDPPEFSQQGRVQNINIISEHQIADTRSSQRWYWAEIGHIGPGYSKGRYSARIALLNDFSTGPDGSTLWPYFSKHIGGINRVYLLGGASEDVGANIMGDVAALLREAANNPALEVHTLVAVSSDDMRSTYVNSTLFELGRLNTPGHVRIEFGPGMIYNSSGSALVNSFNIFFDNEAEFRGMTALLWGMLINRDLSNAVSAVISPENTQKERTPSLSVMYARGLIVPLRLLQDYLVAQMALRLLGGDHLRADIEKNCSQKLKNDCTPVALNSALQDIYGYGLRPTLRFLNKVSECGSGQQFIEQLQKQFTNRYREYLRQADSLRSEIRSYKDPRLNLWLDNEEKLSEVRIHDYARWISRDHEQVRRGYLIELILAGGQRKNENNFANFAVYTDAIDELIENIAYNQFVEDASKGFFDQLTKPMMKQQADSWFTNYEIWQGRFDQIVETGQYKQRRYDLYIPHTWVSHINATHIDGEDGHQDPTFALQTFVTGRIPIKDLKLLKGYINTIFIHNEENIMLDVFQKDLGALKEIPSELQNALTYRDAMWRFYRCWHIGGRGAIESLLGGIQQAEDRELTNTFINKYQSEHSFQQRVDDFLTDCTPINAGEPEAIFTSDNTLWGDSLRKVLLRFANNINDMKSYPPENG